MIEPTRNYVCKNMPANTACEGFRLDNPADERIHLDAVRSAALIDSVRRGHARRRQHQLGCAQRRRALDVLDLNT